MTVAANCKQVLTIIFAIFLFKNKNNQVNVTNAIGITLTLVGGVSGIYPYYESSVSFPTKDSLRRVGMVWVVGVSRGAEAPERKDAGRGLNT